MPKSQRKSKRFKAALAMAGMSMTEWAKKEGITPGHVSQVLSGDRDSAVLMEKIEAFTAKQLDTAVAASA